MSNFRVSLNKLVDDDNMPEVLGLIEKEVIGPNHTKQDYGKLQNDDNPFEALMRIKLFDAEDTVRDKQRFILKGGNK